MPPGAGTVPGAGGKAESRVILTTNGTLLENRQNVLLRSPALHKVNVSLHAFEANDLSIPFETYLEQCFAFGSGGPREGSGGLQTVEPGRRGFSEPGNSLDYAPRLSRGVGAWSGREPGLETGSIWNTGRNSTGRIWARPKQACGSVTASGIRLGCSGTGQWSPAVWITGDIPLGNLLETPLEEILATPRAAALYEGFSQGIAVEPLCRSCGYARRFQKG